jgi:hypothetical protein
MGKGASVLAMLTLRTGAAPGGSARVGSGCALLAPPLRAPVIPRTWSAPKGFSIIPSNIHLAVTAERAISQHFREQILDRALKSLRAEISLSRFGRPLYLKLDLLFVLPSFVLDVADGANRDRYPLARNLDLEAPSVLQGVGKPPQLLDELRQRVVLLDGVGAQIG